MKISSLFLSVVTAFILLLGNKAFAAADIYFVHNDHLGTPQVLTNQEQNVVWQGDYKPFGEVDISVNNVELDARFPGQYQDSEVGVYYNYFRDYDPSLGRYLQSDPIGLNGGINSYGYVNQNPLVNIDFLGLSPEDVERLRNAFNSTVNTMTENGERHPFVPWNAWADLLGIEDYKSCGEQADVVYDAFYALQSSGQLDDVWFINFGTTGPFHRWVTATSLNPDDPKISADPWYNEFSPKK